MRIIKRLVFTLMVLAGAVRLWSEKVARGSRIGPIAGVFALGMGVFRWLWLLIDICQGRLPWQRALLPTVLVLQWALIQGHGTAGVPLHLLVAAGELGLLALVAGQLRRPRQTGCLPEIWLKERFSLFVPEKVARWVAAEATILTSAITAPFQRTSQYTPQQFGYAQDSLLIYVPLAFLLEAPVEYLIIWRAFGIESWKLHLFLIVGNVWGLLWFMGLHATMRQRPHEIQTANLIISKGILARSVVPLASIEAASPVDFTPIPRRERFTVPGTSAVALQLRRPAQVDRLFGASIWTNRIVISADHPMAFCQSLAPHISASSESIVS